MSETFAMCDRSTFAATISVISSPASVDGATRFALLLGPMIEQYGRARVLVSLSPRRAKLAGLLTSGTCGPRGIGSSISAGLQRSLASRLLRAPGLSGSTLFGLTWKLRATPLGFPILAQRASGRRTSDSDYGSWPTPKVATGDYQYTNGDHDRKILNLQGVAKLAIWPTPMAGTPAQKGYNEAGNNDSSRKTVDLCSWATPTSRDGRSEYGTPEMMARRQARTEGKPLSKQALGTIATGSPAPMEKRGQLNPAHSRWLMGYPAEWDACAPTATRSSRKSRSSS